MNTQINDDFPEVDMNQLSSVPPGGAKAEEDEVEEDSFYWKIRKQLTSVHDKIVESFRLIFPVQQRFKFTKISDVIIREAYANYDDTPETYPKEKESNFNLIEQILLHAQQAKPFVHKGKVIEEEDDAEVIQKRHKVFHDLKMLMYRFDKKHRKTNRGISISFLTPGTVIERLVSCVDREPKQYTIKHLNKAYVESPHVECEETQMWRRSGYNTYPFPYSEPVGFNSSHIVRIVKFNPVALKIKEWEPDQDFKDNIFNHRLVGNSFYKTPGSYFTMDIHQVIRLILNELYPNRTFDHDAMIDTDGVVRELLHKRSSLFKTVRHEEYDWMKFLKVNKKKLKKAVRQIVNRNLISKKRQIDLEEEMDRQMYEDMDYDFDGWGSESHCQ